MDGVTYAAAAAILGVSVRSVWRLVESGDLRTHGPRHARRRLSRAEVEAVAVARHRRNRSGGYFIATEQAAQLLGVNRSRVRQLADADLIPYVRTARGDRLYRRDQLEVVANARRARFHDRIQVR